MKRFVFSAAIALTAVVGSAWSAEAACPVAGNYSVDGHMSGHPRDYYGKAVIEARGGYCFVRWLPPNTSEGTGSYEGRTLTVDFVLGGNPGVVRYERSDDGVLHGKFWPKGEPEQLLGTETLTPE
jgi:hypothetical protein